MPDDNRGLSDAELKQHEAADLPDREAMSLVDGLDTGSLLNTSLLNLDVDLNADVDAAAPIGAAVAANANVAAPIDASVGANILTNNSVVVSSADQDSIISQTLTGSATAVSDQDSAISQ